MPTFRKSHALIFQTMEMEGFAEIQPKDNQKLTLLLRKTGVQCKSTDSPLPTPVHQDMSLKLNILYDRLTEHHFYPPQIEDVNNQN